MLRARFEYTPPQATCRETDPARAGKGPGQCDHARRPVGPWGTPVGHKLGRPVGHRRRASVSQAVAQVSRAPRRGANITARPSPHCRSSSRRKPPSGRVASAVAAYADSGSSE
eukprot:7386501-Prymnesium_polylepis.2